MISDCPTKSLLRFQPPPTRCHSEHPPSDSSLSAHLVYHHVPRGRPTAAPPSHPGSPGHCSLAGDRLGCHLPSQRRFADSPYPRTVAYQLHQSSVQLPLPRRHPMPVSARLAPQIWFTRVPSVCGGTCADPGGTQVPSSASAPARSTS